MTATSCSRSGEAHAPWTLRLRFGGALLWACGLGALIPAGLSSCTDEERATDSAPYNVLIVTLDTLRPDHLGCYGYPRPTSPNLDRFAQDCIVFDEAQSSAPWTTPALLSLMSSLHPDTHQVVDSPDPGRMSENVPTLAEVLRRSGYATAAFTEGGYATGAFGLDQGFDLYLEKPGQQGRDAQRVADESHIEANVDRTIDWLRSRRREPFFLFFHTYAVHSPYRAPQQFVERFRPGHDEAADHERVRAILATWNAARTIAPADCVLLNQHRLQCAFTDLPPIVDVEALARTANEMGVGQKTICESEPVLSLARDLYDAGIAHADAELERLWRALVELGLDERTIVVIVSDHGEALGEHGEMEHGLVLKDAVLRIALLLRVPGRRFRPGHVDTLVRAVDVMPTLLDLVGEDCSDLALQGYSLLPLLGGNPLHAPSFSHGRTLARAEDHERSVRAGRWRLIEELGTQRRELYDLESDPREVENVADRNPQVVAELHAILARQIEADRELARSLATEVERRPLDARMIEELRKLGYAGGER